MIMGAREDDEGGTTVSRKRSRVEEMTSRRQEKMDTAGYAYDGAHSKEVTFFFTRFPKDHGAK